MKIQLIRIDLQMRIIANPHNLYMVGKRRLSALKWQLVCQN